MRYQSYPFVFVIFSLGVFWAGCNSEAFAPNPQSFGSLNRIAVVADDELWDGPVGDSLRFYLAAAYPVLPQAEPLFDLQHFNMDEMNANSDRRRFRNMIYLADFGNSSSHTAKAIKEVVGEEQVQKLNGSENQVDIKKATDRWAVNQTILFFYGNNAEALINEIVVKSASIAKLMQGNDEEMLRNRVYMSGRNGSVSNQIKEKYGYYLPVPGDYVVAINDEENDFVWLRKLEKSSHVHYNILLHEADYTGAGQLEVQNAVKVLNGLGKRYIESAQVGGSYLRVTDTHLPFYSLETKLDGEPALKINGIWEMSARTDMMGGPFLAYVVHDEERKKVVYLQAFAFAPGKKKRDMMQGLDMILSGTKFKED